ncbi:cyclohexanone monooxygenase, partial [Pseudomonadales bacterium]|nr:cyclohexanone monooxygenase [Pseudomonadales bacterium]
ERTAEYERRWQMGGFAFLVAYADSGSDRVANETIADFVRDKIRGIVNDPALAEKLCPDFVYASKRPVLDTNYFETFNRDNVTLVDIRDNGIERFTETGIRANGINHEVDCVIFATGFDALTGTLNKMEIRGRGGRLLKDKWAEGPKAYLGLCAEGFPNMYVITGPGSPSVLTNMMVAIEQHVNFIADTMVHMRANDQTRIEAKLEAEEPWVAHVSELGHTTLFTAGANWYFGDNIPGKPRVFLPHVDWVGYVEKCEDVVDKNYDGFSLA